MCATADRGDYNEVRGRHLASTRWAYNVLRFRIGDAWTVRIQSAVLGQQTGSHGQAVEKINVIAD